MGTLSRSIYIKGYCPVDKEDVSIPIGYCSFPHEGETKKNMTFVKTKNNECRYLREGKCDKGVDCPIWQAAESEKRLDVSDLRW